MKLIWSPRAVEAVAAAVRYIAEHDPGTAANWAEGLLEAISQLERFPRSGRTVPELGLDRYRELIHGDFRVIYRIDPGAVVILTVNHGRRLLKPTELIDSS